MPLLDAAYNSQPLPSHKVSNISLLPGKPWQNSPPPATYTYEDDASDTDEKSKLLGFDGEKKEEVESKRISFRSKFGGRRELLLSTDTEEDEDLLLASDEFNGHSLANKSAEEERLTNSSADDYRQDRYPVNQQPHGDHVCTLTNGACAVIKLINFYVIILIKFSVIILINIKF